MSSKCQLAVLCLKLDEPTKAALLYFRFYKFYPDLDVTLSEDVYFLCMYEIRSQCIVFNVVSAPIKPQMYVRAGDNSVQWLIIR